MPTNRKQKLSRHFNRHTINGGLFVLVLVLVFCLFDFVGKSERVIPLVVCHALVDTLHTNGTLLFANSMIVYLQLCAKQCGKISKRMRSMYWVMSNLNKIR